MKVKELKFIRFHFSILVFILIGHSSKAQTFTISPFACLGYSQTLSPYTGSNIPISSSWTASPAGPVFSSPSSSVTTVSFPISGTFTVGVVLFFSSGLATHSEIITILPLPSLMVTQNNFTTCITSNFPSYSKPVHLTAMGATSYTWFPIQPPPPFPTNGGSIDVRPSSSTCYTVVGNTTGCESSATLCITVIPQFSMDVNPFPAIRCIPDSLNLSITNIQSTAVGPISAWSYVWTEQTSTISMSSYFTSTVSVFPLTSSSYTAEMKDSRDCVSIPKVINVTVENCTSIKTQEESEVKLLLYPNPIIDYLHWELEPPHNQFNSMSVSNTLGQTIYMQQNPNSNGKIDLTSLASGFYNVYFNIGGNIKVMKFIKD